jgi:hypothetical protein
MTNSQVPTHLFYQLLVENPTKAMALTLYCTLVASGINVSVRKFGDFIKMSKTTASEWIKEFGEAISLKNRTIDCQDKMPILGSNKAFLSSKSGQKTDKKEIECVENGHLKPTQISQNTATEDISTDDFNDCPHARTCKDILSKESIIPSANNFSFGKKISNEQVEKRRNFQDFFRKGMKQLGERLKVEVNNEFITIRGKSGLIALSGKIVSKKEALKIWNELFKSSEHLMQSMQFAFSNSDVNLMWKDSQLYKQNSNAIAS